MGPGNCLRQFVAGMMPIVAFAALTGGAHAAGSECQTQAAALSNSAKPFVDVGQAICNRINWDSGGGKAMNLLLQAAKRNSVPELVNGSYDNSFAVPMTTDICNVSSFDSDYMTRVSSDPSRLAGPWELPSGSCKQDDNITQLQFNEATNAGPSAIVIAVPMK